jgi:hypothetical protein
MSDKIGKKNAFIASQYFNCWIHITLVLFIPGKPYMFVFALPSSLSE